MKTNLDKNNFNPGQTFLVFLILLLVTLLFIPAGLFIVKDKDSNGANVSRGKEQLLAQKALEYGYEELISDNSHYKTLLKGGRIKGYNFDSLYGYEDGNVSGQYMIRLSSSVYNGKGVEIAVMAKSSENKFSGIRAVYRKTSVMGPIWGEKINLKNNLIIHWGPLYASRRIEAGWNIFPRKFSQGEVLNRDRNGIEMPNTDDAEWWSYGFLPRFTTVDLTAIKIIAQKNKNYFDKFNAALENPVDASDKTRYFDHNLKISGNIFMKGIVVVNGNLELDGRVIGLKEVSVPDNAWREYGLIDTSAENEYPADCGLQVNSGTYEFNKENPLAVEGFLYVGGDLVLKNDYNVYGAVVLKGDVMGSGRLIVYYDDKLQVPNLSETFVPVRVDNEFKFECSIMAGKK